MSLPGSYFDRLYADSEDPWGFQSRWYEERKYALTLAALPLARYRRAFEPGCSIGVLTALLAQRCDQIVAMDPSEAALAHAASRTPPHVELVRGSVPVEWPEGRFDLIVVSEVAYYFDGEDLEEFVERSRASLEPEGNLVAVHWRAKVGDYPGEAAAVHTALRSAFEPLGRYEDALVVIDVLGGPNARLVGP